MTIKDAILRVVTETQGIKAVELVVEVSRQVASMDTYESDLSDLINNGDIIEVEYTLPSMDYRVKSFYLPKDTVVIVSNHSTDRVPFG